MTPNLEKSWHKPAYFNLRAEELSWDNTPEIIKYKSTDISGQEIWWEKKPLLHNDGKWHHPTSYFIIGFHQGETENWREIEERPMPKWITELKQIVDKIKREREFKKAEYSNIPNNILENFTVN